MLCEGSCSPHANVGGRVGAVHLLMSMEGGRRPFAEKYLDDQDAFFADYAAAHAKLSELGSEWEVGPFTLEEVLAA